MYIYLFAHWHECTYISFTLNAVYINECSIHTIPYVE